MQVVVLPLECVRALAKEKEEESFGSKLALTQCNWTHGLEGPHGEEVGHHGAEARGQARLRDEAEFQFCQADDVVSALPVPTRNVQEVSL